MPLARSLIDDALAPAADRLLLQWLATLSTLVARRAGTEADAEVALMAYVTRLRDYPGDIVGDVLNDWPNRSQWWPTWFELRKRLEDRSLPRFSLLEDITRLERLALPAPRESQEDRDAVSEGLRGLVMQLKRPPASRCGVRAKRITMRIAA